MQQTSNIHDVKFCVIIQQLFLA